MMWRKGKTVREREKKKRKCVCEGEMGGGDTEGKKDI